MIYLKLFLAFFQIGLFSIGGGYAALPLIQNQVVQMHGWLNMDEFADIITISQMTPGPIAINSASFVGARIAGIWGSLIATLGCVLPSFIIVLCFAFLYKRYRNLRYVQGVLKSLQPAVVGLIASAGVVIVSQVLWHGSLFELQASAIDWIAVGIMSTCILLLRRLKLNSVYVMLGAGAVGGLIYTMF